MKMKQALWYSVVGLVAISGLSIAAVLVPRTVQAAAPTITNV